MPASLRDMRFLIHQVFDFPGHYRQLQGEGAPDGATLDAIVDEVHRFAAGELEPLNRSGDREGCRLEDGEVRTPTGFRDAYAQYVAGGWAGLSSPAAYGGQGLPPSASLWLEELMSSANMAWTMYPGLSRGVIEALEAHGSAEQQQSWLPPLVSGQWTGTMCLTEPHAGSDVGLARTRAEPLADGAYAITGTKIFISAGEHDLAENIVHLVLARLPDAPEGTRGISMFIVPKVDLDGARNAVTCDGIEEKMGIHGNATCMLNFDGARGYLVGEPNRGMSYMFTMMNGARLVVGLQGVCAAQSAMLAAMDYARERLQMRSLSGPKAPDEHADPIIVHPDVRRLLLSQRAVVEGGRALIYHAGQPVDRAQGGRDADAQAELDFLTPIVKGLLTELGFDAVNQALQVFGGHGFIRETGIEQYVRDARITTIYEGTTQIQALDLLGRKVLQTGGKGFERFLERARTLAVSLEGDSDPLLQDLGARLAAALDEWQPLHEEVGARAMANLDEVGAAASDYLFYSGYLALAWCWALLARAATHGEGDADYLAGKRAVARFYFDRMLPRRLAHGAAIRSGADALMAVEASELTAC